MKKYFVIIATIVVLIMCMGELHAQNKAKLSSIALSIIVPDGIKGFPDAAKTVLTNKLTQVVTANGVGAAAGFDRFFITAIPAIITQDIVPGPPQMIALNLEITFYIADFFDQKVYASTSISCKGVGTNENKAYLDALKAVSVNSPKFKELLENGKQKIIEYYVSQCDNILKQAKSLAGQKKYDEAIYLLTSIPPAVSEVISDCYDRSLEATQTIYQQYIDQLCEENLARAKSAWAAEQNSSGAKKAGDFLGNIYPDAACFGAAQKLYEEIRGKVLDDWKFVMKMQQDEVNLESQRIEAYRAIGVAYGENQKPTNINVSNNLAFLFW